jgi:diacylglycerol kinase family enzyme
MAYYLIGVRILRRFKPISCELMIDDNHMPINTYDLAAITGRYFGPVSIAKDGSVYDDRFTILYSSDSSPLGFLRDVNSFAVRRQHKRSNIVMLSAKQLTIKTKYPEDVQADGEIVGKTPAEIRMIQDAIRVFVPKSN